MRAAIPLTMFATAFACSLATAPAHAAARDRVFVASYGNDANPCTFGSPCKTFQQAVSVVAAGGEVTAIDSAGFGPISITKAVTITSPAGGPGVRLVRQLAAMHVIRAYDKLHRRHGL